MRTIKFLAPLGLSVLLALSACSSKNKEKEKEDTFLVTSPVLYDTTFTKDYIAQIKAVQDVEIRALEKGYLEKIYVDEGQYVHKGQPLFRLMPQFFQAESSKAQAELRAQQIEYQNTKSLADKNVVAPNELALAKAKVDQAKAEADMARLHLAYSEIKAPFDGTIDRIPLKLGSLVDEGELLTTISDNSQLFAYFNLSEPEYLNYQTDVKSRGNTSVNLVMANGNLFQNPGKVETMESEFDSETGTIAFRARFPNGQRLLKNGETGKVRMTIPLTHALIIPQKATYEIQDKTYVFVVDKNGKVHSQNITIAAELPDLYVIHDGIGPQDKILLEGVQKVKENQKVEYHVVDGRKAISQLRLAAE